jgi:hypothetical protein
MKTKRLITGIVGPDFLVHIDTVELTSLETRAHAVLHGLAVTWIEKEEDGLFFLANAKSLDKALAIENDLLRQLSGQNVASFKLPVWGHLFDLDFHREGEKGYSKQGQGKC